MTYVLNLFTAQYDVFVFVIYSPFLLVTFMQFHICFILYNSHTFVVCVSILLIQYQARNVLNMHTYSSCSKIPSAT